VDFEDTREEAAFRAECRAWLEANAKQRAADAASAMAARSPELVAAAQAWQGKKADAGWACRPTSASTRTCPSGTSPRGRRAERSPDWPGIATATRAPVFEEKFFWRCQSRARRLRRRPKPRSRYRQQWGAIEGSRARTLDHRADPDTVVLSMASAYAGRISKKQRGGGSDPENEERRRVIKGGLLAVAAGLGLLPACGDEDESAAQGQAAGGSSSGAAGGSAPAQSGSVAGSGAAGQSGDATAANAADGGATPAPADSTSLADAGGAPVNASSGSLVLPRATLGKTGVSVPIVGLGTSRLGQRGGTPGQEDFDYMVQVFGAAMDMGIEYIDTGAVYGRAEEALGQVLPGRRDDIFLVTKLYADSRSQAQSMFERSLERMGTDHVDVLHLHSVGERNLDTALSANGAWPYILEQKAAGTARFVGITGHNNPPNFLRMLETDEVDVLMTIMNFVDHSTYGFTREVREDALARGVGVMAMKVFGGTESVLAPGGGLANSNASEPHPSNMEIQFDESVLPDCMRFVKTLGGITGMVIGVNHLEELEKNIRWAIETQPFSDAEMEAIVRMGETVAPMWAQRYG